MSYYNLHGLLSITEALTSSLNEAAPIQAFTMSTTEIQVVWNVVTYKTSYQLLVDTTDEFLSPTTINDISEEAYLVDSLTIGTEYFFKVIAKGTTDSEGVVTSATTLSFVPDIWAEFGALAFNRTGSEYSVTEDDFGYYDDINNEIDQVKPVFGSTYAGTITANPSYSCGVGVNNPYFPFRGSGKNSTNFWDLSTDLVLGDFHIACKFRRLGDFSATNENVIGHVSSGDYIFLNNTRLRSSLGGSAATNITYVNSLPPTVIDSTYGTEVTLDIKRVGSTVYISWDKGVNYDSGVFNANDVTISRLFAAFSGIPLTKDVDHRFLVYSGELTTSQLNEFFDFGVIEDHTPNALVAGSTIDIGGVTYSDFPADGIFSDTIHMQAIGIWTRSGRLQQLKDKHIVITSKATPSPTYVEDSIRVINESNLNETSALIDLGTYHRVEDVEPTKANVHNLSSTFIYNNCLYVLEVYPHYGFINVKRSGYNFDFSQFTNIKTFNGLLDKFGYSLQYLGIKVLNNNEIYIIAQRNNNGPNEIICLKTTTDFAYMESWLLCKIGASGDVWVYPHMVEDNSTTEATIVLNIIDKTVNPSPAVPAGIFIQTCMIKTVDFETLTNKERDVSNEVRSSMTELTLSDLTTNYSISADATEDVTLTNIHYDTTLLEYFAIEGDGAGGWNAIFIVNSTGAKTTKAIDLGAITVVDSRNEDGGYIYKKSANNYEVYLMATIGGFNVPYKFSTTDKGVTWSQDGIVTGIDATKNYNRIWGTENQWEATKIFLETAQIDTGNDAFLQLIEIT